MQELIDVKENVLGLKGFCRVELYDTDTGSLQMLKKAPILFHLYSHQLCSDKYKKFLLGAEFQMEESRYHRLTLIPLIVCLSILF